MAGESVDNVLEEEACSMNRAPLEQGWQKHAKPKALKEKKNGIISITINIPVLFAALFVVSNNKDCANFFSSGLEITPNLCMANLK